MKRKLNKDFIIFLILIPVFLSIAFYISSRMDNKLPNYSVSNKASMGYSVFYEALKELNYKAYKTVKPIDDYENTDMQIVVQNPNFNINSDSIKKWVKEGGTIVYLTLNDKYSIEYDVDVEEKKNIEIYKYYKGNIIVSEANFITNKALTEDTDDAYKLLDEINNYSFQNIYFNETYMFVDANSKSLWDYMPIELKFIIYQILIVVIAFFYYKGKRFGRAVTFKEEVERVENEFLYSSAALYKQAKCWDIMAQNYYKYFLKQINCAHENWLQYWQKEDLPKINKAKRLFTLIDDNKNNEKDYIEIIKIAEQLNTVLKKRRELYWKALKKTL